MRGSEWGKEEEREALKANVSVIESRVELSTGQHGRIISIPGSATGKIGSKVECVLRTINTALSSPTLTTDALIASKIYLFLLPIPGSTRERIVGCVVAQSIETAMKIVEKNTHAVDNLVHVDGNIYCDPTPLRTSLGVSRIFVTKAYRRSGIAHALLDAAARTFIHGCLLDPLKGHIAFSQPTGDGQRLMSRWGKGCVRIFDE